MREIGETLRQARIKRGISLQEAEAATKIRLRYLEAMEKGNFSVLPGRPYALGFLRSYARFLGLDAQALVEELKKTWEPERPVPGPQYVVTACPEPAARTLRPRLRGAGRWLAVLALVILLAVLVPVFTTALRPSPAPQTTPEAGQGGGFPAAGMPAQQSPAEAVEEDRTPEAPPPEGLELVITADKGPSWLEVTVGGREVYRGMLSLGKQMSFTAQEAISVKFGDAGAVSVTVNGRDIGPVGRRGDVVRREFRPTEES